MRRLEIDESARNVGKERNPDLVTICDPAKAYATLCQALLELPRQGGGGLVRLTGRFAVDALGRPGSDLSRLVRDEVVRRGHELRLLVGPAGAEEPVTRTLVARLVAEGARVRVSSGPLPNLGICGSELAVVYAFPRDGQQSQAALVARHEAVAALDQYQLVLWEHASEPKQFCHSARPAALDETQVQVLKLLGSGMKDDAAARQMNVSVRTYRRHVAAILKSLHVNTRFEAGLKAAELGLLSKRRPSARESERDGGRLMPSFL